jgi:hypothetical protein
VPDEPTVEAPRPYQRTPFQVAVLTFLTFGFYAFYWLTRTVRQAARILEREPPPWWHAFGMAVPILNLLVCYQWFGIIAWAIRRSGLEPSVPYGFFIPVPLILTVIGNKAPNPWFFLAVFFFVPFAVIAYDMIRAEMILQGSTFPRPQLNVIEIVLIIFGLITQALAVAGALLDESANPATLPGIVSILVGVVILLAIFGVLSKRAEQTSLPTPV